LAERIVLEPKRDGNVKGWGVDMTVALQDGRSFDEVIEDFPGCPAIPFSADRLQQKFRALTMDAGPASHQVFDRLLAISGCEDVRRLWQR
jgi:hypothetical protein